MPSPIFNSAMGSTTASNPSACPLFVADSTDQLLAGDFCATCATDGITQQHAIKKRIMMRRLASFHGVFPIAKNAAAVFAFDHMSVSKNANVRDDQKHSVHHNRYVIILLQ